VLTYCSDHMTQRPGANTEKAASPSPTSNRPSSSAAALAAEVTSGTGVSGGGPSVDQYVRSLSDPKESAAVQAARVVEELANQKPELLAPHIETLVTLLGASAQPELARPRVVQAAAHSLPLLARVAPAKVAKHLKTLQGMFEGAADTAKDGIVRTFVALCVASVTYQKRLIANFELALRTADAKQLTGWTEHILPALKGEPYAQARAVVEQRLNDVTLPRPIAQRVAELLGVKLRTVPERK
jgi:hypothetical protein